MKQTMVRTGWGAILAAAAVAVAGNPVAGPGDRDWPQFRGPERNGVAAGSGIRSSWPEAGPKELWRRPIGEGYSAISVVGNRLYTMYANQEDGDNVEYAAAFDADSGKEIWRFAMGERFVNEFGNGPRSTPTVDGKWVYVLDSRGNLAALAADDGKVNWQINLPETFGSKVPTFGYATSPLIDGDLLLLEAGGPEGKSYVGLDKNTGEARWTFGTGGPEPGYNSPLRVEIDGSSHYVYVVGDRIRGVDGEGREVWSHEWPRGETHAIPLFVAPDKIFASGAEGVGATLLHLEAGGDGLTAEPVWQTRFMRNHFSASVHKDGHIYGFDNATLKAISVEDGELAWARRGLGKGSLIVAGDHLVILSDRGKLLLVQASPDGYVETGSVQALEGLCWTAPVLAGGRLYLRNHSEMVAYDLAS